LRQGSFLLLRICCGCPALPRKRRCWRRVNKPKTVDTLLQSAAVRLSHLIRMDEYKRSRMKNVLSAAGLNTTPELFTAMAIVKAASVAVLAVPSIFVLPLLAPVALFLTVLIYFKEIRKADEALSAKRSRIEQELPEPGGRAVHGRRLCAVQEPYLSDRFPRASTDQFHIAPELFR